MMLPATMMMLVMVTMTIDPDDYLGDDDEGDGGK